MTARSSFRYRRVRGINVPYYGYVEARLKINEIEGMDEDSLFLSCQIPIIQKQFQFH